MAQVFRCDRCKEFSDYATSKAAVHKMQNANGYTTTMVEGEFKVAYHGRPLHLCEQCVLELEYVLDKWWNDKGEPEAET